MNENIDLTKILKDCPKGWKFYSSVYGKVEFLEILKTIPIDDEMEEVIRDCEYPVKLKVNICEYRVSKAGEHQKGVGECTLFPSKDQRDWSKFIAPWYKKDKFDPKTLQPFDKVLQKIEKILLITGVVLLNVQEQQMKLFLNLLNMLMKHIINQQNYIKH